MAAKLGMEFRPKLTWDAKFSPIRDANFVRAQTAWRPITREEYERENGEKFGSGICHQLWDDPQINWDGKVIGCCRNFWGDFGGNAFADGFLDSINNEKMTYAREMLIGQKPARDDIPCSTCEIYIAMRRTGRRLARPMSESKSDVKSAEAIAYARARAERRELRELRALKSDMIAAMDRLKAVEASTTWRATLPLRKVGKHLPRVMRRALRLGAKMLAVRQRTGQMGSIVSPIGERDTLALSPPEHPRVLIIEMWWPRPDRSSGSLDAIAQIRALRDFGWEVVFAVEEYAEGSDYRRRLEDEGVICLSPSMSPSVEAFLQSDGKTLDLCILSRVIRGGRFFEAALQHAPQARLIFNTIDLHHLRREREAAISGDQAAMRAAEAMRERELYLVDQADATIVVSSTERAILARAVPGAAVFEMPLARPVRSAGDIPGFEHRNGVGFVGGFKHRPNVDAVRYLLREIWPRVLELMPEARLSIVGPDLPSETLVGAPPNVEYLGHLPGLDPWLDRLRLTVAPLRYGAGVKGKIASSLAAGVPCVCTPIAAEGMRLNDGVDIAVCATPESFAARICQVHNDPALWACLSSGGHRKASLDFTIERGKQRLASLLNALGLPIKSPG